MGIFFFVETTKLKKQLIKDSPKKFKSEIELAIQYAEKYHKGQLRLSKEPYVNHGLRTAITLAQMGMDTNTIIAGLLHNSTHNQEIEVSSKEIEKEIQDVFGEDVSNLIILENNISKATSSTDTEHQIVVRSILNGSKDLRPVLIKLAETLDNVRTIEYMPKERIQSKLHKIIKVYVPLAEYLNLDSIKKELEEKALEKYRPEEYELIKSKLESSNFTEKVLFEYQKYLTKILSNISPKPSIHGRLKSIYSIYNKQKKKLKEGESLNISNIRDLIAFRLITNNTDDCFKILEYLMDNGDILTEEFDDYITHPKKNGYKALQGPVVLPSVSPNIVEVHILTHDMHYYNTYGPASHIAYKESKSRYANPTDKYTWIEEVHKQISNNISQRESKISVPILVDIFPSNVYAFTPKGKIIELRSGDTTIDFAYRVHTDIGNSMISAKVNNLPVKLDYNVKTGDTIEIKTQIGKKSVKEDWIKYANSPSAQYKIQKSWKK